jgi:NAD(P)-dependent dehydrogenase (short-subunit alcohol dehydrogenase family)
VIIEDLGQINANGSYMFKHCDISDLELIDTLCKEIAAQEAAVDLLFLTAGALSFGKQGKSACLKETIYLLTESDTKAGIDLNHMLRYYSRMRFVLNLIPLL